MWLWAGPALASTGRIQHLLAVPCNASSHSSPSALFSTWIAVRRPPKVRAAVRVASCSAQPRSSHPWRCVGSSRPLPLRQAQYLQKALWGWHLPCARRKSRASSTTELPSRSSVLSEARVSTSARRHQPRICAARSECSIAGFAGRGKK